MISFLAVIYKLIREGNNYSIINVRKNNYFFVKLFLRVPCRQKIKNKDLLKYYNAQ